MPWINNKWVPESYYNENDPSRGYDFYTKRMAQRTSRRNQGKGPGYGNTIPAAYNRYMGQIFGPGGTQGYIKGQVQGVSDVLSPYLEAMGSQGAASIGARGGLATGAQDAYKSALVGQKVGALGQATTQAQQNVTNVGQNVMGLAQREGFQMTQDDLSRLRLALEERGMVIQERQLEEMLKDPGFYDYFNSILGAGASAAGAYFGGGG